MTNKTGVETPVNLPNEEIQLPIEDNKLLLNCRRKINSARTFSICWQVIDCMTKNPYYIENGILKRYIDDN